jgi:F0F1-type ATP synthase assembly protein I
MKKLIAILLMLFVYVILTTFIVVCVSSWLVGLSVVLGSAVITVAICYAINLFFDE